MCNPSVGASNAVDVAQTSVSRGQPFKGKCTLMISGDEVKRLHDRTTRGMNLSAEEQVALAAWYRREDEVEASLLRTHEASETVASLRTRVDMAFAQLAISVQRIQETSGENERIRREIADLRHQLADSARVQPA